jgi:hypothetical protein
MESFLRVSLSWNSSVFSCDPSNTFKLALAVLCAFSIHRIQDVRAFYSYVFLLLRFKDG